MALDLYRGLDARQPDEQRARQHQGIVERRRVPGCLGEPIDISGPVGPQLRDEHRKQAPAQDDEPDDAGKSQK
jgi:hypothetical protein